MNFFSLFKRKLIYNLRNKILIDSEITKSDSLDFLLHHYGSDKANIFKKNQVEIVEIGVRNIEKGINKNSLIGKIRAINMGLKFKKRLLIE